MKDVIEASKIIGILLFFFVYGIWFDYTFLHTDTVIYERQINSEIPTVTINADKIYSHQVAPMFETTGKVIIKFSPNTVCIKDTTGYVIEYK